MRAGNVDERKEAAGEVGIRLVDPEGTFPEKLAGVWIEEKGQDASAGIRAKRRSNLVAVAAAASDIVGERRVTKVPGRVLFPILEAAPNEDDPVLQRSGPR